MTRRLLSLPRLFRDKPELRTIVDYINTSPPHQLILSGTGSPQNVVVADIGTLFLRLDGGANTTLYVKEANSGQSTGWVAK